MLASGVTTGKALSKAVYVFSPDTENGKVAHVNFLPKEVLELKVLDAKAWLGEVSKIIGGKVGRVETRGTVLTTLFQGGGKDDSATGVGNHKDKIEEAMDAARKVYRSKVEGA